MRKSFFILLIVVFVGVFVVGAVTMFGGLVLTADIAYASTNSIESGHIYSVVLNDLINYISASSMAYGVQTEQVYISFSMPSDLTDMVDPDYPSHYFIRSTSSSSEGFRFSDYGYGGSTYPQRYTQLIRYDSDTSRFKVVYNNKNTSNASWTTTESYESSTTRIYFYCESDDFGIPSLNTGNALTSGNYFLQQFKARATDEGLAPWVSHNPEYRGNFSISVHPTFLQDFIPDVLIDVYTYSFELRGVQLINTDGVPVHNDEATPYKLLGVEYYDGTNWTNPQSYKIYYSIFTVSGTIVDELEYIWIPCIPEEITDIRIWYYELDGDPDFTYLNSTDNYGFFYNAWNNYLHMENYINRIGVGSYQQGYADGYADQNNLLSVLWATFDFPVHILFGTFDSNPLSETYGQYVGGLFNFTILGLDVRAFVLGILSLCLIVAILKVILGRFGGR